MQMLYVCVVKVDKDVIKIEAILLINYIFMREHSLLTWENKLYN